MGVEIAILHGLDLALDLAQIEKQSFLIGRRAHFHQAPGPQDIFLDRCLDPPHGVSGQSEPALRFELLDGLHQTDIAFRHDFADRQAVAAVAHCDFRNEAQMACDKPVGGLGVVMLAITFGKHVFFVRLQHWKPADLFHIPAKASGTGDKTWK